MKALRLFNPTIHHLTPAVYILLTLYTTFFLT